MVLFAGTDFVPGAPVYLLINNWLNGSYGAATAARSELKWILRVLLHKQKSLEAISWTLLITLLCYQVCALA